MVDDYIKEIIEDSKTAKGEEYEKVFFRPDGSYSFRENDVN